MLTLTLNAIARNSLRWKTLRLGITARRRNLRERTMIAGFPEITLVGGGRSRKSRKSKKSRHSKHSKHSKKHSKKSRRC